MLTSIVYRSSAIHATPSAVDLDIFKSAVIRNLSHRITGSLHREKDLYFQQIEGPHDTLFSLFRAICADTRHEALETLDVSTSRTRRFPGRSMRYSFYMKTPMTEFLKERGFGETPRTAKAACVTAFLVSAAQQETARLARTA